MNTKLNNIFKNSIKNILNYFTRNLFFLKKFVNKNYHEKGYNIKNQLNK